MKKIILLLVIVSVTYISCKKDSPILTFTYSSWSDCTNGTQTRTVVASDGISTVPFDSLQRNCDMACLITGTWKLSEYYVLFEDSSVIDFLTDTSYGLAPCEVDDTYKFNGTDSGGSYNYKDAGIQCSTNGSYNGNWTISNNTFNFTGSENQYQIKSFSCTKTSWTSQLFTIIDSSVTPPIAHQYNYNRTWVRP